MIMSGLEFSECYLDPKQISKVKNSFVEYKKIGGTSVPKLQLQRHEQNDENMKVLKENRLKALALEEKLLLEEE